MKREMCKYCGGLLLEWKYTKYDGMVRLIGIDLGMKVDKTGLCGRWIRIS